MTVSLFSATPQTAFTSQQPIRAFIQLRSVERLIVFSASLGITASQTADTKCIPEGANCSKACNNDSFVLLQPVAESRSSPTKSLQNGSPSKCPRYLKIKNWETGAVQNDTLHNSSTKVTCMEMCFINGCKKLKDPAGSEEGL